MIVCRARPSAMHRRHSLTSLLLTCALAACRRAPAPAPTPAPTSRTCEPPTQPRSALAWGVAPMAEREDARGRVVDATTGVGLSASVTLEPGGHRASADSLGTFRVPALPGGTYLVRVQRIGYEQARHSVRSGLGGLRLFAALAPPRGMVTYACIVPIRVRRDVASSRRPPAARSGRFECRCLGRGGDLV